MKKSAIKDIFHGFRGHIDTMYLPEGSKVNADVVCKTYDELKEKFKSRIIKTASRFC